MRMNKINQLENTIKQHAIWIENAPDLQDDELDICNLILSDYSIYEVAEELQTSVNQVCYTIENLLDKIKNVDEGA